jgi:RNA polymerase sigma-70 factor (ECF subfamily)
MSPSHFADELVALLPRLRRFALSLCGDRALADDLVQGACERALKARDQWEPGTRLDSWTFRILRNLWLDGIRKTRSEGVTQPVDETLDLAGEDGRRVAHASITASAVMRGVASLPDDHRRVLTMVCIEGMSYREAADALGTPIGTVMSRLSRARRALAEGLGMTENESPLEASDMNAP